MKVFNSKSSLDSVFSTFESVNSESANIFYDTLPSQAFAKKPRIGSLVLQSKEITADVSSVMRQGSSPAFSALGATTAFNAVQGIFNLEQAYHSYQSADQMHDVNGKWMSLSDMTLRVAQCFGGLSFVLVRSADIAIRGFSSFKFLDRPALVATVVGTYCFGILYLGLFVLSGISLSETRSFLKRLEDSKKGVEELKSLIEEITGKGIAAFSKVLSKRDVYVHLGIELRSMFREIDPKLGTDFSNNELGKALFNEKYNKFLPAILNRLGASSSNREMTVEDLKKDKGLIQAIWAKEKMTVYERILGLKGGELVRKAIEMNLGGLLLDDKTKKYAEEVSKALVEDLEKCSKKQSKAMIAYFITGILGAIFTGLSLSTAAAMPPITLVCNIGFLIVYLTMGYGDFQCFLEVYKTDGPIGKYAQAYVLLHFALGIAAITTAVVLTSFTGGAFPLITLFVVGGIWMASGVGMSILLRKRDRIYKDNHPTLSNFVDKISSSKLGVVYKESLEMFNKLPKLQREAILKGLLENYKDLQKYAHSLDTFSKLLPKESLEIKRKRLYRKLKGQKLVERSFEIANKKLLARSHLFTEESLSNHPCSHIFYNTFYDELAKSEQEKFLARAGEKKLYEVAKKLLDRTIKTKNIENVAETNLLSRFAG